MARNKEHGGGRGGHGGKGPRGPKDIPFELVKAGGTGPNPHKAPDLKPQAKQPEEKKAPETTGYVLTCKASPGPGCWILHLQVICKESFAVDEAVDAFVTVLDGALPQGKDSFEITASGEKVLATGLTDKTGVTLPLSRDQRVVQFAVGWIRHPGGTSDKRSKNVQTNDLTLPGSPYSKFPRGEKLEKGDGPFESFLKGLRS